MVVDIIEDPALRKNPSPIGKPEISHPHPFIHSFIHWRVTNTQPVQSLGEDSHWMTQQWALLGVSKQPSLPLDPWPHPSVPPAALTMWASPGGSCQSPSQHLPTACWRLTLVSSSYQKPWVHSSWWPPLQGDTLHINWSFLIPTGPRTQDAFCLEAPGAPRLAGLALSPIQATAAWPGQDPHRPQVGSGKK